MTGDMRLAALAAFALPTTCPACGTGTEAGFCPPRVIHTARVLAAVQELSARTRDQAEKHRYAVILDRLRRNAAAMTEMHPWEWLALVNDRKVLNMAPSRRATQPYPIVSSGRAFRR